MVDLVAMTDEELATLAEQIEQEKARRSLLVTAAEQAAAMAAAYAAAIAAEPPTPWASLKDRVAPGQRVVWTDGETYRNKSGAWLPITANPSSYPLGYSQETGLPDSVDAWSGASVSYALGAIVTHNGRRWRCLTAHTSQPGWAPGLAHSLWAEA